VNAYQLDAKRGVHKLENIPLDEKDRIVAAIHNRQSFKVVGCGGRMSVAVQLMERAIEAEGLTCRIFSSGRKAAMAGMLIPTGVTQFLCAISAVGMAAHNLATYNPDYEIEKHPIDNYLLITFKK
jgi:hypothetical protein